MALSASELGDYVRINYSDPSDVLLENRTLSDFAPFALQLLRSGRLTCQVLKVTLGQRPVSLTSIFLDRNLEAFFFLSSEKTHSKTTYIVARIERSQEGIAGILSPRSSELKDATSAKGAQVETEACTLDTM